VTWITFSRSGRPRRWRRRPSLTSPSGKGDTALAQRIFARASGAFTLFTGATCSGTQVYTATVPVAGTSSQTVSTSIATAVTATGTYSWQVSYDSTNAAQRDIPASCQETSSLTIANGGTVTSP